MMCSDLPSISLMDVRTAQAWLHLKQHSKLLLHSLHNVISHREVLGCTAEEPWAVLLGSLLTLALRSSGGGGWQGFVLGFPLGSDEVPLAIGIQLPLPQWCHYFHVVCHQQSQGEGGAQES